MSIIILDKNTTSFGQLGGGGSSVHRLPLFRMGVGFARRGCHPDVDRGGSIKDGLKRENINRWGRAFLSM